MFISGFRAVKKSGERKGKGKRGHGKENEWNA